MKALKTKLSAVVMFCFLLLVVCPIAVHAENNKIPCGENVYGTLDETGVLTISGSGDMRNYNSSISSDFYNIRNSIYKVVVEDGVTSIGAYAFGTKGAFDKLQSVSIGKGVKSIGAYAFYGTGGLISIDIPGNVQTIGAYAFYMSALKNCTLDKGLREIQKGAFKNTKLHSIVIPDGITAIREYAFYPSLKIVTIPSNIEVIEAGAFSNVSAAIYSKTVTLVKRAFGSDSTLTVVEGSSADTYASNYSLNKHYFKCFPSGDNPAQEHDFDEGTDTKTPTCMEQGSRVFTCKKCGEKETQVLDLANHQWNIVHTKNATCVTDGEESIRCSVCNIVKSTAKIPAKGHIFSKWKVTTKPTVLKAGKQTRKCSVCGKSETESVTKLKPILKLSVSTLKLKVGQSSEKIKVVSKGRGDSIASWTSTNTRVVTVNSKGKIQGKSAGTAKIRVKLKSGISKTVKVTVK